MSIANLPLFVISILLFAFQNSHTKTILLSFATFYISAVTIIKLSHSAYADPTSIDICANAGVQEWLFWLGFSVVDDQLILVSKLNTFFFISHNHFVQYFIN